uniref:Uncharacterized protein n=1 Tax=Anguilla anguilla TaxID=7936 RepID=A0A0E9RC05_ANGAN
MFKLFTHGISVGGGKEDCTVIQLFCMPITLLTTLVKNVK